MIPYDAERIHRMTSEELALLKVKAAQCLLGTAMNVSADSAAYKAICEQTVADDYPGVLHEIALRVLHQPEVPSITELVMGMVVDGYASRIQNGVLVTDLYWNADYTFWRQALRALVAVRAREQQIANAISVIG